MGGWEDGWKVEVDSQPRGLDIAMTEIRMRWDGTLVCQALLSALTSVFYDDDDDKASTTNRRGISN